LFDRICERGKNEQVFLDAPAGAGQLALSPSDQGE